MVNLTYVGAGPTDDLDISDNAYLLSLRDQNLDTTSVTNLISTGTVDGTGHAGLFPYALRSYVDSQDSLNATKAYIDGKYANGDPIPESDLVNYNPYGGDAARILKTRIDTSGGPVGLDSLGKLNRAILTIPDAQKWPAPGTSPGSYNAAPVTTGGVVGVDSTVYSYTVADPGYPYNLLVFGQVDVSTGADDNFPVISVRAGDDMTLVGTGYGVAESYGIAPAYDATGVGYNGNAANFTFTHTGSAGAYLIVDISIYNAPDVTSCTFDGVAMTQLALQYVANSAGYGSLVRYGMANIPGGARTVSVVLTGAQHVTAGSVSYTGVASVGTTLKAYGNAAADMAQNVTCGNAQTIVQAFANRQSSAILAPSGGTSRGSGAHLSSGTYYAELEISDAKATTNFTATTTAQSYWAALATPLNSAQYPNHSTAVIEPYFANMPANPPAFDAAGRGYLPHYGGAKGEVPASSFRFAHTAAANSYVIIDVVSTGVGISSVTYDGVVLTPLAATYLNNVPATGSYNRYGVVNVDAGTKSIGVALTGYGAVSACSVSYTGVKTAHASTTMYASGVTNLTQHADAWAYGGDLIVHGFAADQINPEWALAGGTPRFGQAFSSSGSTFYGIVEISDSQSSATFQAASTIANASGIATVLTGVRGTPAQSSRTGATTLYLQLGSSAAGAVTATTTNPSLTAIPIPAT